MGKRKFGRRFEEKRGRSKIHFEKDMTEESELWFIIFVG